MSAAGTANDKRVAGESFQKTLRLLQQLAARLVAIDTFAMALHSLYVLLERHNLLPRACSERAYSTDALRYELRMNPFLPITLPELVPYEDYHRMATLEGVSDAVVLERATRAVAEARKGWEAVLTTGPFLDGQPKESTAVDEYWKKEVKDTMRACIGTSIAIETMRRALNSSTAGNGNGRHEHDIIANLRVDVPDIESKARWHDWWAVPRILELTRMTTIEMR